jgi:nicotinamidase-related amidase
MGNTRTALIVIDAQKEYAPGGGLEVTDIESSLERVKELVSAARSSGDTLVIFVRHVSRKHDDSTFNAATSGVEFIDGIAPEEGDPVITKQFPNAFTETSLDRLLRDEHVRKVVVCGYTSLLCCDSTAREASERGYEVLFVDDAIGEFPVGDLTAEEIHRVMCAGQDAMFSTVVTTDEAVSELG